MNPGASLRDGCEATGGPGRDVLAGREERLGEGIVVRQPRPAEGRNVFASLPSDAALSRPCGRGIRNLSLLLLTY